MALWEDPGAWFRSLEEEAAAKRWSDDELLRVSFARLSEEDPIWAGYTLTERFRKTFTRQAWEQFKTGLVKAYRREEPDEPPEEVTPREPCGIPDVAEVVDGDTDNDPSLVEPETVSSEDRATASRAPERNGDSEFPARETGGGKTRKKKRRKRTRRVLHTGSEVDGGHENVPQAEPVSSMPQESTVILAEVCGIAPPDQGAGAPAAGALNACATVEEVYRNQEADEKPERHDRARKRPMLEPSREQTVAGYYEYGDSVDKGFKGFGVEAPSRRCATDANNDSTIRKVFTPTLTESPARIEPQDVVIVGRNRAGEREEPESSRPELFGRKDKASGAADPPTRKGDCEDGQARATRERSSVDDSVAVHETRGVVGFQYFDVGPRRNGQLTCGSLSDLVRPPEREGKSKSPRGEAMSAVYAPRACSGLERETSRLPDAFFRVVTDSGGDRKDGLAYTGVMERKERQSVAGHRQERMEWHSLARPPEDVRIRRPALVTSFSNLVRPPEFKVPCSDLVRPPELSVAGFDFVRPPECSSRGRRVDRGWVSSK